MNPSFPRTSLKYVKATSDARSHDSEYPTTRKKRILLKGDIPTPLNPPSGCVFHTRCPIARFPICSEQVPALIEHRPGQFAACHFAGDPVPADTMREASPAV